jgi:DNA-binding transcriptional regulator YiaG
MIQETELNVRMNDLRMALNETQTDFGRRFGVSASCLSLWEQGKRQITGPAIIVMEGLEREHAEKLKVWSKARRRSLK